MGAFTAPAANATLTHGLISVKGTASDDAAVSAAFISIQNRTTGKWLTSKAAWSATLQQLPVTLAKPNLRSTTWSVNVTVPPAKMAVSLVVKDSKGLSNVVPRPSRLLTLR
jgi:hypothetical protein